MTMKAKTLNDGRVVVDEMCQCGHKASEHGSQIHELSDGEVFVGNEGQGGCTECNCDQFTWKGFVFAEGT